MKNLASNSSIPSICLVGNGRLAAQLTAYLDQSEIAFTPVFRSQYTETEITQAINLSSHVWLAISDSSIESFYETFAAAGIGKTWVHFSGAHNSKNIFSAHPLMTFSKEPMPLQEFESIHFTVSPPSNSVKRVPLTELLPGCRNPWSYLPAEKKAFYHALCVIGGNFPMILWSEVLTQFQSLSIPNEALYHYLDRVLLNFKNEGSKALTGPLVRNDLKTIYDNLNSLDGHPYKAIYESFVQAKGIKL